MMISVDVEVTVASNAANVFYRLFGKMKLLKRCY